MRITVTFFPDKLTKEIDLKAGSKIIDVLKKLHLRPDNLIVLKNNTPIPVDETLTEKQDLNIVKVSSGG
jgi:sulfur carrier protein ThiS